MNFAYQGKGMYTNPVYLRYLITMKRRAVIWVLLLMVAGLMSCRSSSMEKSMKKINDRKEEQAKVVQDQYDRAMRQHMKNQSKETRRQMKKHNRESGAQRRRLFGGNKERINCGHAK